jgi:spermidine synthase
MIDDPAASLHVKPYVHESPRCKALHFSLCEIQSRMQIQDPHALDLDYTRLMMGFLLFKPEPRQIAMIGLGGGSLAKFCHRYLKAARIEVVEINPHVIALRDEFLVPPDDARLRVVQGDGARFVRDAGTRCDVLLVDGFDSDGLPARLSSQRFYDDCCDMLQDDGIMVANLHTGDRRFPALLDRIGRSFDDAVLVVDGADLSNSIVFAGRGRALDTLHPRAKRGPARLDAAAAGQLRGAFAAIALARKARGP